MTESGTAAGLAAAIALTASCAEHALQAPKPPLKDQGTQAKRGLDRAGALHVLGRLTFGVRPGDAERLQSLGLEAWLEQQLATGTDVAADAAVEPYRAALLPPDEVVRSFAASTGNAEPSDTE